MIHYDEFAYFRENADEAGLVWRGAPVVRRETVDVDGHAISALVWGTATPELVLLHGGGQNAHTWDSVALALDRPLVAIDLPGHGHSDWREDGKLFPSDNAAAIRPVIDELAPDAHLLVGMSLGGLTALAVAGRDPGVVERVAIVDVLPTVDTERAGDIIAFLAGPETFASFDEILERTIAFNPTRSESSLRRGVLHNAIEQPDGSWRWRYQRFGSDVTLGDVAPEHFDLLWDDLARIPGPFMLVRGADSPVVADNDVAELLRRKPNARVEVVAAAGHSIQGDQPLELARLLDDFARATMAP